MLVALNESGFKCYAPETEKGPIFSCPNCEEQVILKKGEIKIHHFAHKIDRNCYSWEPESKKHLEMKEYFYNHFKRKQNYIKKVELEYRIGELITDVYLETVTRHKIAIECQVSNKSLDEIIDKTKYYQKNGVSTWWVFYSNNYPPEKNQHGEAKYSTGKRSFNKYYKNNDLITIFTKDYGMYGDHPQILIVYRFNRNDSSKDYWGYNSHIKNITNNLDELILKPEGITFEFVVKHKQDYINKSREEKEKRIVNGQNGGYSNKQIPKRECWLCIYYQRSNYRSVRFCHQNKKNVDPKNGCDSFSSILRRGKNKQDSND